MPLYTVRQMLADVARPILVAATTDVALAQAERAVCADTLPIVDAVLGDLNAQDIIPQTGRRNAAVSNLTDRKTALGAVDRTHVELVPSRLYNAWNAIEEAIPLIAAQRPSDEVTF